MIFSSFKCETNSYDGAGVNRRIKQKKVFCRFPEKQRKNKKKNYNSAVHTCTIIKSCTCQMFCSCFFASHTIIKPSPLPSYISYFKILLFEKLQLLSLIYGKTDEHAPLQVTEKAVFYTRAKLYTKDVPCCIQHMIQFAL